MKIDTPSCDAGDPTNRCRYLHTSSEPDTRDEGRDVHLLSCGRAYLEHPHLHCGQLSCHPAFSGKQVANKELSHKSRKSRSTFPSHLRERVDRKGNPLPLMQLQGMKRSRIVL